MTHLLKPFGIINLNPTMFSGSLWWARVVKTWQYTHHWVSTFLCVDLLALFLAVGNNPNLCQKAQSFPVNRIPRLTWQGTCAAALHDTESSSEELEELDNSEDLVLFETCSTCCLSFINSFEAINGEFWWYKLHFSGVDLLCPPLCSNACWQELMDKFIATNSCALYGCNWGLW